MLEKMLFVRIATRIQWPEGSASIMLSKSYQEVHRQ